MKELLQLLFIILFAELSTAGEYCNSYSEYCTHYCCGSYPNEYCCTINIPFIIGIVIGGAILISFIACIICVCIKKKGKTRRVIGPGELNVVIALYTIPASATYPTQTQYHSSFYTPLHSSVPAPPVYGQPGCNPPAYTAAPSAPVYQAAGITWTPTSSSQYGTQLPPLPQGLQSHYNNMQNT